MSTNLKFVQAQAFTVAGAGAILGDVTVDLSSFAGIDGVPLTMANFGSKGFMTFEPNSGSQEEQISFTGIVQNANGTATLTGISNVLFVDPYTEVSGFAKTHAGGVQCVVSNTAGFYNSFANRLDDETILQTWTFTLPFYPRMSAANIFPTDPEQLVTKAYADSLAFNGAPNASTTVQGLVQEATVSQLNAGTALGSTGAVLFGSPADFAASIYGIQLPTAAQKQGLASVATPSSTNTYQTGIDVQKNQAIYGVDSVGTDSYVITPTPAISAYTDGMTFYFKAGTANTGACTLQVGSGSALAIVKQYNTALVTGDILQHQIVEVCYNATNTNWQMVSPVGTPPLTTNAGYTNGQTTYDISTASGTQTIAHGLGVTPKNVRLTAWRGGGTAANPANFQAFAVYNGSTQSGMFNSIDSGSNIGAVASGFVLVGATNAVFASGAITFDSTNITITWTKTGSPTGTYILIWEAVGPNT